MMERAGSHPAGESIFLRKEMEEMGTDCNETTVTENDMFGPEVLRGRMIELSNKLIDVAYDLKEGRDETLDDVSNLYAGLSMTLLVLSEIVKKEGISITDD